MASPAQSVFETPAYACSQAAHYVGVPTATLRSWIGKDGLIQTPEPGALSFNNLAEAHIVRAMRRKHRLSLQAIRRALEELGQLRKTAHPLLDETFETDGVDLCIRDEEDITGDSWSFASLFRYTSIGLNAIPQAR